MRAGQRYRQSSELPGEQLTELRAELRALLLGQLPAQRLAELPAPQRPELLSGLLLRLRVKLRERFPSPQLSSPLALLPAKLPSGYLARLL